MYFHAPCGVVLYCFVCKLYANKEKKKKKKSYQVERTQWKLPHLTYIMEVT